MDTLDQRAKIVCDECCEEIGWAAWEGPGAVKCEECFTAWVKTPQGAKYAQWWTEKP